MPTNTCREPTASERKLASIAVQLATTAAEHMHGKSIEEVALWAADQMNKCGFKNQPVGAEWAHLTHIEE